MNGRLYKELWMKEDERIKKQKEKLKKIEVEEKEERN